MKLSAFISTIPVISTSPQSCNVNVNHCVAYVSVYICLSSWYAILIWVYHVRTFSWILGDPRDLQLETSRSWVPNYHLYFYNIYDFLCRRTKQFQAWTKTSTAKAVSVPIKEEGGFWSYEKFQAEGNGITPACITVKTGKKISENQWNAKRLVRTQIKLWFFHYSFWYGAEIFCLCSALGIYILHRAYIF